MRGYNGLSLGWGLRTLGGQLAPTSILHGEIAAFEFLHLRPVLMDQPKTSHNGSGVKRAIAFVSTSLWSLRVVGGCVRFLGLLLSLLRLLCFQSRHLLTLALKFLLLRQRVFKIFVVVGGRHNGKERTCWLHAVAIGTFGSMAAYLLLLLLLLS